MNSQSLPPHEYRRLVAASTARSEDLEDLISRRIAGEPLQYLEGSVLFGPIELSIDSRVLIPRPETENLFDLVTKTVRAPRLIVDLCTGSGALALALKNVFPAALVIGTDLSANALDVASGNGADVEWLRGDLFSALPASLRGKIDLLVANPPYVADGEWEQLPVDVRHEPKAALVAGPQGTEVVERILRELGVWMAEGASAWIEIGETQGWLAEKYPVEVVQDQYGVDRYLRWT